MALAVAGGEAGQRHEEARPMDAVAAMEAGLATFPETGQRAEQVGLKVGRTGAAAKGVVASFYPWLPWCVLIASTRDPAGKEAAGKAPLQAGEPKVGKTDPRTRNATRTELPRTLPRHVPSRRKATAGAVVRKAGVARAPLPSKPS